MNNNNNNKHGRARRNFMKLAVQLIAMVVVIVVIIVVIFGVTTPARYKAAVQSGLVELSVPREMESMWPESTHWIAYFSRRYGEPVWHSQVVLCDAEYRYVLSYAATAELSTWGSSVIGVSDQYFVLNKHPRIQNQEMDQFIYSSGATVYDLNAKMWREFVRTGGTDPSLIGIGDCWTCP